MNPHNLLGSRIFPDLTQNFLSVSFHR